MIVTPDGTGGLNGTQKTLLLLLSIGVTIPLGAALYEFHRAAPGSIRRRAAFAACAWSVAMLPLPVVVIAGVYATSILGNMIPIAGEWPPHLFGLICSGAMAGGVVSAIAEGVQRLTNPLITSRHFDARRPMDSLKHDDIPYGNNWDSTEEAAAYADAADRVRPWRNEIREHIAARVAALTPGARVLELGSGPGLLAARVLDRCRDLASYTLLDFSPPMLDVSRQRLAAFPAASFVLASFKSDDWPRRAGGPFDAVVSMQAVHELRHKRHAPRLYAQVHGTLTVPGLVLICDHTPFDASPKSTTLYMTREEQQHALEDAGFTGVHVEFEANGLILYAGSKTA